MTDTEREALAEERELLADLIWTTARKFNPSDPRFADAIIESAWLAARETRAAERALRDAAEALDAAAAGRFDMWAGNLTRDRADALCPPAATEGDTP